MLYINKLIVIHKLFYRYLDDITTFRILDTFNYFFFKYAGGFVLKNWDILVFAILKVGLRF